MVNTPETGFALVIYPHRSLGKLAYLSLMVAIIAVSFIAGIVFIKLGAWPITGFFGLDVLLVWWAFRSNYNSANRHEVLERAGGELVLRRFWRGREVETIRLIKSFTRVEIEHDQERELTGPLILTSRGQEHEIGSFLGAAERLSLSEIVRKELRTWSY